MQFRTVEEMEQLLAKLIMDKDQLLHQMDEHKDSVEDNSIRLNLLGTVVRGDHNELRKDYENRISELRYKIVKLEDEVSERTARINDIRQKLQSARQSQTNRIACS